MVPFHRLHNLLFCNYTLESCHNLVLPALLARGIRVMIVCLIIKLTLDIHLHNTPVCLAVLDITIGVKAKDCGDRLAEQQATHTSGLRLGRSEVVEELDERLPAGTAKPMASRQRSPGAESRKSRRRSKPMASRQRSPGAESRKSRQRSTICLSRKGGDMRGMAIRAALEPC